MKAHHKGLVLVALISATACKTQTPAAGSRVKEDDATTTAAGTAGTGTVSGFGTQTTAQTLAAIAGHIGDGNWDWEINPKSLNEDVQGEAIRVPGEGMGVPYAEVQVCDESQKVEMEGGKKGCIVMDNAMTYDYTNGKRVAPYNNLIPQRQSEDQPDMDKWMQEGDIVIYFHPERRSGQLNGDAMQWRVTHAATVVRRDGKIATADTPSGYARPFDGNDDHPVHVFRFMPKDEAGNDLPDELAQKYRLMIAKWATLGFNQFTFTGSYDSAAGQLKGPKSIATFGDYYLKAAIQGDIPKCSSPQEKNCFPLMYCAWFVYTNLNLAWMHPMNAAGLAAIPSGAQVTPTGNFEKVWRSRSDNADPIPMTRFLDNDAGLKPHADYAFQPMTAYGLVHGFLVRIVGEDEDNPALFVARALNKAGILAAMSKDEGIKGTFASEEGYVPNFDAAKADAINAKIGDMMLEFAGAYKMAADKVQAGTMKPKDAIKMINDLKDMRTTEKNAAFQDYTKRWIPPYTYAYVAENFGNRDLSKRPVLAYVGTVVHEKFLKKRGAADAGATLSILPSRKATDRDRALDKAMYAAIGMEAKDDMKGYQFFFECLADKARANCGSNIKRWFNEFERDALLTYANDWKAGASINGKDARTRNTWGLDAVLFRRLLGSYWNDPAAGFRPNLLASATGNPAIQNTASNIRLLMSAEIDLAAAQADASKYATGERKTPMPCLTTNIGETSTGTPPSCSYKVKVEGAAAAETFDMAADSADGDHRGWPATRAASGVAPAPAATTETAAPAAPGTAPAEPDPSTSGEDGGSEGGMQLPADGQTLAQ